MCMDTLHDRIGRVVNTAAFESSLASNGVRKIEFQATWNKDSVGDFSQLRPAYQEAVLAGEQELGSTGEVDRAASE